MQTVREELASKAPEEVEDLKTAEKPAANKRERKGDTTVKTEKGSLVKTGVPNQTFPAEGFVNAYGFIHLSNGVAEAFGVSKGKKTAIIIELQEGKLMISKA